MLEGSGGLSYSMEPDSMYAAAILENIYLVYNNSGLFFNDNYDERRTFLKKSLLPRSFPSAPSSLFQMAIDPNNVCSIHTPHPH
jgi:hypothetical protein